MADRNVCAGLKVVGNFPATKKYGSPWPTGKQQNGRRKMVSKQEVVEKVLQLGFADVGFTSAASFESQLRILEERKEEYDWFLKVGFDMFEGTDPGNALAGARSIIVVIDAFFRESFPPVMEAHFGRTYLDDDRKTLDRGAVRIAALRKFLLEHGVNSSIPINMPQRLSAARAGLGSFGKNSLFFANKGALGGSWTNPIALVVDAEFAPDQSSIGFGCPEWCRDACVAACPTRALQGGGRIDPRRCISQLTQRDEGITPIGLREEMGLWVYGCDRCQDVCPRNAPILASKRPPNEKVAAMEKDFQLTRLLQMDEEYFSTRIWPHMFYTPVQKMWRWKMNAARAMGNSRDSRYLPELCHAFGENSDARVCGMIAWAIGRLGGEEARRALDEFLPGSSGAIREEIQLALVGLNPKT